MKNPFLAQYTIRSKQAYIFRTNRLAEITGASAIIASAFKIIFECAKSLGLSYVRAEADKVFSLRETIDSFSSGKTDMVELFIGGGNDTILFRDKDVFIRVNRSYTRKILEEYPGMIPMCVGVGIDPSCNNYRADYDRLMAEAEREKNRMIPGRIQNALPFAMMDRTTNQPYSHVWTQDKEEWRRTDEAVAKLIAGKQDDKTTMDNRILDMLVTEHGEESLLAIVHADGNNMGTKIQSKLGSKENGENCTYDHCVNIMRRFTKEINDVFTVEGKKAVGQCLKEIRDLPQNRGLKDSAFNVRWVVNDGDDATFICNARFAKALAEAYLKAVSGYGSVTDPDERYSSCAGICIFHSHYPVARAYELAEQACDLAKKTVHDSIEEPNGPYEECWLDFHYIHSGVGGDLEEIRELHNTKNIMARPWFVAGPEREGVQPVSQLDELAETLKKFDISRANIKTFGAAFEEDEAIAKVEWERTCYNAPVLKKTEKNSDGKETEVKDTLDDAVRALIPETGGTVPRYYKVLYDLSEVYDLWYGGR